MNISVELSFYPMDATFEPPIIKFIERLQSYENIEIQTNSMSTFVHGDYDQIMNMLSYETKAAFQLSETAVMVMKILKRSEFNK